MGAVSDWADRKKRGKLWRKLRKFSTDRHFCGLAVQLDLSRNQALLLRELTSILPGPAASGFHSFAQFSTTQAPILK
jgi:hypothetical protein